MTANFQFLCKKHNIHLDGYPSWILVSMDPDEFCVSYTGMHCPETDCTILDWEVIMVESNGSTTTGALSEAKSEIYGAE